MPQIIDYAYNYTTVATGTTIACDVPDTATNDILIAILTQDTGATPTWTCTGWTQYFTITNTTATAMMWRVSTGASEPASYTFTTNTQETLNVIMISIRDVDTTTPFVTQTSANRASHNTAFPSITTNRNNSLILYISGHPSTAVVPSSLEGPVTQLFQMDGSAHSDSVGWGWQATAGATGTGVSSSVTGTTYNGSLITLAVRPPSGGATLIPAYCSADASLYLDPLHGITAFRGNTAPGATAATYYTGTVGGKAVANAAISARIDTGINSFRSTAGQTSSINRTWLGIAEQFAAAKTTMAGKNILCHVQTYLPADIQTLEGIGLSRGCAIGLHTSASNFKVWHVHGANTPWGTRMTPVVVNTGNTSGAIQTTGTLNTASIGGMGFLVSGFVASADMIWTMIWQLDTTTVCGGNATTPVDVSGIVRAIANGKERMSALQQGKSQMLVLQPFQLGDGTKPTYVNLATAAIEFPQQYNIATGQTYYCSTDNVAGVTFYPASTDTFDLRSSVWSSASKFHWGFSASSSATATVLTDGMQVIGAGTITLSANVDLSGVSFSRCDQLTAVANTMTDCTFSASTATTGAYYITGASGAALQTALDTLVGCTFSGNTIPSGALRIVYTGSAAPISLNMSSGVFSGNTADIRWEAPASSALTLNLTGTANPTTYSATNSNTVSFVSAKTFVVTNVVDGTEVRIYKQSDLTELGGAENVGASPSGLNGVSVAADPDNAGRYKMTYAYNYTGDIPVYVVVIHNSYQALRPAFTLKSTDTSLQVSQIQDRQYLNP